MLHPPQWHGCPKLFEMCPAEYDVCDVRHKRFDDDACKELFPEAYAITYWTHSWG